MLDCTGLYQVFFYTLPKKHIELGEAGHGEAGHQRQGAYMEDLQPAAAPQNSLSWCQTRLPFSRRGCPDRLFRQQPVVNNRKNRAIVVKVRHRENILQVRIHQARTQWVKMFWSVRREYLKRAAVCTEVYSTELRCTFSVLY